MKVIDCTDDGVLTIELSDEDQQFLIEHAINDILRKGIEIMKKEIDDGEVVGSKG